MYTSHAKHNIVRDYDKSQGTTHPADLSYQIIRDYNIRYITVENSSPRPVGYAITNYLSGPIPDITRIIDGGEIHHLGINSHGSTPQHIWLLDPNTKKPVGTPTCIRSNSNQLVLRDGVNKWFIHFFKRASYSPAF